MSSTHPPSSASSIIPFAATYALTKIFTPAPSCKPAAYTFSTSQRNVVFMRAAPYASSQCWLPGFPTSVDLSAAWGAISTQLPMYSPGRCPEGYSGIFADPTATEMVNGDVTSVFCCPSNFYWGPTYGGCNSFVTTPTTVVQTVPGTSTITASSFLAVDYPVVVAWQSTDLSLFERASRTVATQTHAMPTSTNTSQPTPNVSVTSQPSRGLARPTIAGIAVGVVVAVLILAVGAFWLGRLRSRQSRWNSSPTEISKSESTSDAMSIERERQLSDGNPNIECQRARTETHHRSIYEADPSASRMEMDGGWRGHEMHQLHR